MRFYLTKTEEGEESQLQCVSSLQSSLSIVYNITVHNTSKQEIIFKRHCKSNLTLVTCIDFKILQILLNFFSSLENLYEVLSFDHMLY